jgi:hypothetical protein
MFGAALFTAACNKAQRPDSQVASDVQGKINADNSIRNKQLSVQAANGILTLSGSVSSDAERSAVANDAAGVSGVRTVVNNLTVQPVDATAAQNQQPPDASQPPAVQAPGQPAPPPATKSPVGTRAAAKSAGAPSTLVPSTRQNAPPQNYGSQADAMRQQQSQPDSSQNAQNTAPAPPVPRPTITIPDGTALSVRLIDSLDSENASVGDKFTATINSPVRVDGQTVIPSDADLEGRVVEAHAAGRFQGRGLLTIEITRVSFNGRSYKIQTNQWSKQTDSRGKGTAEKVGGGAVLGTIIGAISGGGKGAGIGAAVGAGAGGVTQSAIRAAQIKLGPESTLTFRRAQPVTIQPSTSNERNSERQHLEQ